MLFIWIALFLAMTRNTKTVRHCEERSNSDFLTSLKATKINNENYYLTMNQLNTYFYFNKLFNKIYLKY